MTSRSMRTLPDITLGQSPSEIPLTNAVESIIEELTIVPIVAAAGENMTIVSANAADVGAVLRALAHG